MNALVKSFTGGMFVGGLTYLSTVGLLMYQAKKAKGNIPLSFEPPLDVDGVYGRRKHTKTVTIAILGDSMAAGLGCKNTRQTPGALIAKYISRVLGCKVKLYRFALVSARTPELGLQVHAAKQVNPDIAIILIGGNDITHNIHSKVSGKHLMQSVSQLRSEGVKVVVGTCPDLSVVLRLPYPLRLLARARSHELADAQARIVEAVGGTTVNLTESLISKFSDNLDEMLGPDKFHPSPKGYEALVRVLFPAILNELRDSKMIGVA